MLRWRSQRKGNTMGVLSDSPPQGGLLADLLARLFVNGRPITMGNAYGAISPEAEADLRKMVDVEPSASKIPPMPSGPMQTYSQQMDQAQQPPMPPMAPPQQAIAAPPGQNPPMSLAQQGPMGGMMNAPNVPRQLPLPMQKPPQTSLGATSSVPMMTGIEGGWPLRASPDHKAKPAPTKSVARAKSGLSESDLLNMQQLAMILARRQAAGG